MVPKEEFIATELTCQVPGEKAEFRNMVTGIQVDKKQNTQSNATEVERNANSLKGDKTITIL